MKSFFLRVVSLASRFLPALLFTLVLPLRSGAAERRIEHVFLITADGFRWQEVFRGAEELLLDKVNGGVGDTNAVRRDYWRATPEARRQALLPFFWSEIAGRGQIFGNQDKGSVARVTNGRNFSYPGYSELLTGAADPRIDSNDKNPNPNTNVLEWLHARPAFRGRVAAFGAWDVHPFILNRDRAGFPIQAGWEIVDRPDPAREAIHQVLRDTTRVWDGVIYDAFMFHAAMDHIRQRSPRVCYLAFGETDDWAHDGRYDRYLQAAARFDGFVRRLWEFIQSNPVYKDRTALVLTTDHGRGTGPVAWKNHGQAIVESAFIWVAVLGPGIAPLGERANTAPIFQNQVAATVAMLLGEDYKAAHPAAGGPIPGLLAAP